MNEQKVPTCQCGGICIGVCEDILRGEKSEFLKNHYTLNPENNHAHCLCIECTNAHTRGVLIYVNAREHDSDEFFRLKNLKKLRDSLVKREKLNNLEQVAIIRMRTSEKALEEACRSYAGILAQKEALGINTTYKTQKDASSINIPNKINKLSLEIKAMSNRLKYSMYNDFEISDNSDDSEFD